VEPGTGGIDARKKLKRMKDGSIEDWEMSIVREEAPNVKYPACVSAILET